MLTIGGKFGDYTVEALLGQGGMGEVYKIRAENGAVFAVKVMTPPNGDEAHEFRRRFAREAKIAMALNDRNLVKVYDVGEDPETGLYYIIMDYLPGGSMAQKLKFEGRLPIEEALSITIKIASALGKAHKAGVIHRDIKPDNIMLDASGRPKLTDLGIAKLEDGQETTQLTSTGVVIGTPAYMAPEQMLDSHNVTPKADIYSLGLVLYEMLTGERAHGNSAAVELMSKVLNGEEARDVRELRPEVPDSVSLLVKKMCANQAEERPESMDEVVESARAELKKLREHRPETEGLDLAIRRWRFMRWRKMKKRTVVTILAIAVTGIMVTAGMMIEKRHRNYVAEKSIREYCNQVQSLVKELQSTADRQRSMIIEREWEWERLEQSEKSRSKYIDGATWKYWTDGVVASIIGVSGMDRKLRIPDSLDGKQVVRIAGGVFKWNEHLEEVEVPDSVRSIGTASFAGCKNLHTVKLGRGLQSIGESAFSGCVALQTLEFPEELKIIADCAFAGCHELCKVEFGGKENWIGKAAFKDCRSIRLLSIPGSIQVLSEGAFEECTGLTKVIVRAGCKVIKTRAFGKCTDLREATIPAGMVFIEPDAFAECWQLDKMKVQDSRTCIDFRALNGCPIRVDFKLDKYGRFGGFGIKERK